MVGHLHLQDILESGYTDREKARCLRLDCGNKIGNHKKMIDRYNSVGMENLVFTTPDYDYLKGIRKFTQTELETLQTLPIGYTKSLNIQKAGDCIGDGWTVDVICHILSYLKE